MVESTDKPLVVITGISGYIGLHVLQQFLQTGDFRVRGTVRGLTEAKIAPIRQALGEELFSQLKIVCADLLDAESLGRAINGAFYVIHTASPFPIKNPANEDVLVQPALDGTLAVCRACHVAKVKRLVITSSVAAMASVEFDTLPKPVIINEDNWSDVAYSRRTRQFYNLSKTLAEKAAWEFLEKLPQEEKFELAVINPSFVVGKPLHTHLGFSSAELISKAFSGEAPSLRIMLGCVRVEDVALAHLRAIQVPEAAGNRFVLSGETMWFNDLYKTMADEFNPQGYNVKTGDMSYWTVWFLSIFIRDLANFLLLWEKEYEMDHSKAEKMLGIKFQSPRQGVNDMVYALIDAGLIEDKRKK